MTGACRHGQLLRQCDQCDALDEVGRLGHALTEARALAWAAGLETCRMRNVLGSIEGSWQWMLAFGSGHDGDLDTAHNGWWPTRAAEHAKAVATRELNARWRDGWARPLTFDSGTYKRPQDSAPNTEQPPTLEQRLDQLWTMVEAENTKMAAAIARLAEWRCEVAGDVAGIDALAAQVARIERAVRVLADAPYPCRRHIVATQILDGGDDD
jgi:hypothetical protein